METPPTTLKRECMESSEETKSMVEEEGEEDCEQNDVMDICKSDNPTTPFTITPLPPHWRSNKSLPMPFCVYSLNKQGVPDGTKVTLSAASDERGQTNLRNGITYFHNNVAEFHDLRFVGKSGRGKYLNLVVSVWTSPEQPQIVTYNRVIKITADGPRKARRKPLSQSTADSSRLDISNESQSAFTRITRGGVQQRKLRSCSLSVVPLDRLAAQTPSPPNTSPSSMSVTGIMPAASLCGSYETKSLFEGGNVSQFDALVFAASLLQQLQHQQQQQSGTSSPMTPPSTPPTAASNSRAPPPSEPPSPDEEELAQETYSRLRHVYPAKRAIQMTMRESRQLWRPVDLP